MLARHDFGNLRILITAGIRITFPDRRIDLKAADFTGRTYFAIVIASLDGS